MYNVLIYCSYASFQSVHKTDVIVQTIQALCEHVTVRAATVPLAVIERFS